jgi:hypothetical protein
LARGTVGSGTAWSGPWPGLEPPGGPGATSGKALEGGELRGKRTKGRDPAPGVPPRGSVNRCRIPVRGLGTKEGVHQLGIQGAPKSVSKCLAFCAILVAISRLILSISPRLRFCAGCWNAAKWPTCSTRPSENALGEPSPGLRSILRSLGGESAVANLVACVLCPRSTCRRAVTCAAKLRYWFFAMPGPGTVLRSLR